MAGRGIGRRAARFKLLVEGDEDKRVIPQLIEQSGIPWGETRETAIVEIESYDGLEPLLAPGEIGTQAKSPGLEALGILVDADDDSSHRWRRVHQECLRSFPSLPEALPSEGIVHTREDGVRLGVWIMPDNASRGMLETFLACLVPDPHLPLLDYARHARDTAQAEFHAPFIPAHVDKALIHTWLAWQDPPGCQLHHAVLKRLLHPASPYAAPFLAWFRKLYNISQ